MTARLRRALVVALSAAAIGAAGNASAAEPQARVELAPDVVGLDEPVDLLLEVTVDGFQGLAVEPAFELENLDVAAGPMVSKSQRWVNGRTSSTATLTWRLRPRAVGTAAVRGVRLRLEERVLELPDREIEVVEEAPPRRRARPPGADPLDAVFGDPLAPFRRQRALERPRLGLVAEIDRPTAWVGEQVVWSLALETQTDISAFRPSSLPDFSGFWVRDLALPDGLRPQWIERDGVKLARVIQLRRALVPLRAGKFTIEPARAEVVARLAESSWFGPLGRDESFRLASRPLELEVRALPPAPPGFAGLVGPVTVEAALDPARIVAGQAATLTVTATGAGHLAGIAPPVLALPAGLATFAPGTETLEEPVSGRLRTRVTWRYVLVPDRPGRFEVPAVELAWFDPGATEFRVAASAPLPLEVASPTLAGVPESAPPAAGQPPPAPAAGVRLGSPIALASAAALALVVGGGLAALRRGRGRPVRASRRRLADAIAAARAEPSPRQAAVLLEEAWRHYAAQRWQLAAALPVAHWPAKLVADGVAEPRARALVELFDELHYLRYAPELSSVEALRDDAVERSLRLLRELG